MVGIGGDALIPVAREGLKVLGGVVGTNVFCTHVLSSKMDRILGDLNLLEQILHCHLLSKLAIYCCNGRPSYFFRLAQLRISSGEAQRFDTTMAEFFRETCRFQPSDNYGLHAAAYERASQQLQFSINEGGWGLALADLTASSALYGGLGSFVKWYRRFRALEKGQGLVDAFYVRLRVVMVLRTWLSLCRPPWMRWSVTGSLWLTNLTRRGL